jgi:hypothetical protein
VDLCGLRLLAITADTSTRFTLSDSSKFGILSNLFGASFEFCRFAEIQSFRVSKVARGSFRFAIFLSCITEVQYESRNPFPHWDREYSMTSCEVRRFWDSFNL